MNAIAQDIIEFINTQPDNKDSIKPYRPRKKQETLVQKLMTKPIKEEPPEMPHFSRHLKKNYIHQVDLLYLPSEKASKYALTVIDIASRLVDAEPIRKRDSYSVMKAIEKIYARNILDIPNEIQTDNGSEFKGNFESWLNTNNIKHRTALTNRHRQQALVEKANSRIAKPLFARMLEEELQTGKISKKWLEDLPKVVATLNKNVKPVKKQSDIPTCYKGKKILDKRTNKYKYVTEGDCDLLEQGTKVRRILDYPIDHLNSKRLGFGFRETDVRWDKNVSTISHILIKPYQPPMYILDDNDNVAYTKKQLQVVDDNEIQPRKEAIRKPKRRKRLDWQR